MEWAPVCAEGETYANKCMADAAGAQIEYEGECENYFTKEQAQIAAKKWLEEESPTFKFDGIPGSIKYIGYESYTCFGCFGFTFTFNSSHAGYGNRSGQMLAQAIANHTILVQTRGKNVSYALTDGAFDELRQIFICPAISALIPVCGTDNITYPHPCPAMQAGVKIAYEGECQ
ncbi:hypothetical protein COU37_02895 [Candidatus Micrarchaeota archaeon CG10_big_fil_rev_8_21_14_0_10_45_29]|nr:MAG: hypothetical protein COU37_02895 [Candidatus Micrarchaeota archaeon CG10_big_fil_rev_8_21_14_0_10_45_29]